MARRRRWAAREEGDGSVDELEMEVEMLEIVALVRCLGVDVMEMGKVMRWWARERCMAAMARRSQARW